MRRFPIAFLPIAFLLGVGVCLGAQSDVLSIKSVVCTGSWKFDTTGIGQYGCAGAIDGLTTDSTSGGPTGNATFWLGREQTPNETLTFDLGSIFSISSVDLYNTHNGVNNDRGTVNFKIWISTTLPPTPDNNPSSSFGTLVLSNTLVFFPSTDPNPRQSFSFSPALGRYVTFRAENFAFNFVHFDGGTGLSEIVVHGRVPPAVYVANAGSHSVSVINPTTSVVEAMITVGRIPVNVVVTPDGSRAYVANAGSNSVSVIDTATFSVISTITVGRSPVNAAVTPEGSRAYVANAGSNSVSVINTETNTVVTTVPVGSNPVKIAITSDGASVYVTNAGTHTVSVISTATNTVVATVPVGANPVDVTIH